VGDLAPVSPRSGRSSAALGVLVRNIGRLRRLFGVDQAELVANLRELADTWEEKYGLVSADLVAERPPTRDEGPARRRAARRRSLPARAEAPQTSCARSVAGDPGART
jgi:hypothetical protein